MTRAVVFIHGAWVTSRCWEHFAKYFTAAGYRCLTPSWPHLDQPAESLRATPPAELAALGATEIVDHYHRIIEALDAPPILIGHSFGGLFVQMLLDRGLGRAGVAIHPAPPRGVLPGPTEIRATLPVLASWRGWRKTHLMSPRGFARDFANGLPDAERGAAYDRYAAPTSGRLFFQAALAPFSNTLRVDFRNPHRAPLLILAGGADRTVSPRLNRANYRRYRRSPATTGFQLFPGRSHFTIAEPGWQDVADAALDWLDRVAADPPAAHRESHRALDRALDRAIDIQYSQEIGSSASP